MKVPIGCSGCGELTRRLGGYCDSCECMTVRQVAERLHITPLTVWRMTQDGRLWPMKGSGGKLLIARAQVDALLEGRRYTPPDQEPRTTWDPPSYPLAR